MIVNQFRKGRFAKDVKIVYLEKKLMLMGAILRGKIDIRGAKRREILEETKGRHNSTGVISPQVFNFPPVILDDFLRFLLTGG